jgi:hypothetical protein
VGLEDLAPAGNVGRHHRQPGRHVLEQLDRIGLDVVLDRMQRDHPHLDPGEQLRHAPALQPPEVAHALPPGRLLELGAQLRRPDVSPEVELGVGVRHRIDELAGAAHAGDGAYVAGRRDPLVPG